MNNKLTLSIFLISLAISIALAAVSLSASNSRHGYLNLAAFPKADSSVSIDALENMNDDSLTLTYENVYNKSVSVIHSNHNTVVKGTNHRYPAVMGYGITNGGFFTEEALDNKNNFAVLNKKAAFDMFGTLNAVGNAIQMDAQPYLVVGVMDDRNEDEPTIFVPATCLGNTADIVVADLSTGTEESVINELKQAGISTLTHDFVNTQQITKTIEDIAAAAFKIMLMGAAMLVIRKTVFLVTQNLQNMRQLQQYYYVAEILRAKPKPLQKLLLMLVLIFGLGATILATVLSLTETFLHWNSLRESLSEMNAAGFLASVTDAERLLGLSNALFVVFIVVFSALIVLVLRKITPSSNRLL